MKNWLTLLLLLLLAYSVSSQQWDLLTPLKSGKTISGCSFIDENRGVAVMETGGNVLLTENGGKLWKRIRVPGFNVEMSDVEMLDANTIIACGEEGIFFKSEDFGVSWVIIDLPTDEFVYAIDFATPLIGYAAGFNGVVLKTVDAGNTWNLLTSGTSSRLLDIQFSSDLIGYACGYDGVVIKTVDGGDSWELLESGYDSVLYSMSVPTAEVVFCSGWDQTIISSTNGGASFVTQHTGTGALEFIEFRDTQNGWAAGDWGRYVMTSDGGNSWTESEATSNAFISCGQYVNEQASFLMGKGIVLGSADNTESWSILKNAVPNSNYHALFFHDDMKGHIAGAVGVSGGGGNQAGILATDDGGQTWDVQGFSSSGGWRNIHFSDENFGTLIGSGFARTTDGGENWSSPSNTPSLTGGATHWFNADEGVIGGDGLFNGICKTNNGGGDYNCDMDKSAGELFFLNENLGYAISEGGTENVFRTVDGGDNWEFVPTGNGQAKHSIFFLDENIGWIGGFSGTILKTADGGLTWDSYLTGYTVVGMRFYDENNGFCVDSFGNVYKSTDGGENWTLFLNGDDLYIAVAYKGVFTENFLYIGSQNGDIYKCELGCSVLPEPEILTQEEWCTGEDFQLDFMPSALVQDYTWTFPADWEIEPVGESLLVTAGVQEGVIGLEIINNCGIPSYREKNVTIANTSVPEVELGVIGQLCIGTELDLTITDVEEGEEFYWDYAEDWDGTISENTLTLGLTSPEGWASVIRVNACTATTPYFTTISAEESPEVEFSFENGNVICDNVELVLDSGLPLGGAYSGEFVSDGILAINGSTTEETVVSYSVTAENGCTSIVSETIAIQPSEIMGAEWGSFDYVTCGGEGIFGVTGAYVGIDYDSWDVDMPESWGDMTIFSVDHPLFVVEDIYESGTLSIRLLNEQCGAELVFSDYVEILDTPEVPSVANELENWCMNSSSVVEISTGVSDSLIWSSPGITGNLITIGATDYILELEGSEGGYELTLRAENECGVSPDTVMTYEVLGLPEVSLSFGTDTLCLEQTIPAIVSPAGGTLTGIGATGLFIESYFLDAIESYDYQYAFTDENGCTNLAEVTHYFENCVGVQEEEYLTFEVFPNPTSERINLIFDSKRLRSVKIIDVNGKIVKDTVESDISIELDVSDLVSGEYFIIVENRVVKFIME